MKKHFAALFGVDYEQDILPYWLVHWIDKRFDSYTVYLHRETGSIEERLVKLFQRNGWTVHLLDGSHRDGGLRGEVLSRFAASLPPDDFLITADADEFHLVDYDKVLGEYDIVRGFMSDYYGYVLEACHRDPFDQYMFQEEFTGEYLKNFSPPFMRKSEWKHTKRTKILAARAGYNVAYAGSHCMLEVPINAKILENQLVHHFAWRESAKSKLAVKSYYTEENLREVCGGEIPSELSEKFSRLKEIERMTLV